jgi:asparagine synthase (glutamine-hydrolysing)
MIGLVISIEVLTKTRGCTMSLTLGLVNVDPPSEWVNRLHAARGSDARVWLGRANQPLSPIEMQGETDAITLVYQGRLSGEGALRTQLKQLGIQFASDNPVETLVRAYQVWGESLPERIDGSCVLILWDRQAQRLLAIRDRLGIGRLYIAEQNNGLILSTDLRTLLTVRDRAAEPDAQAMAYLLTLGYVPGSASIWKGISKLEPGECLTWDSLGGVRRRRYWEPPRITDPRVERTSWRDIFESALDRICAPGEPVGLMLSAGLDSSSIALGLSRLGRSVKALTFSTPGVPDESPLAEALAQHLRIPHVGRVSITTQGFEGLLNEMVPTLEEPPCHHAAITSYLTFRAAAKHFDVLLTGDGAEETLGGRDWYGGGTAGAKAVRLRGNLSGESAEGVGERRELRRSFLRRLRQAFAHAINGIQAARLRRTSTRGPSPLHQHVANMRPPIFPSAEVAGLLAPTGISFSEADMLAPLVATDEPALPQRRRLQRLDLMNFCPNVVLPKVQQASSAHGLEARLPFLDYRLVEWTIAKPLDPRENTERKPVLRDYLRGHVPDDILNLSKHGLNPTWTPLLPIEDTLRQLRNGYWVRNGYWARDLENYVRAGDRQWRPRLWSLYLLERWAAYWLR